MDLQHHFKIVCDLETSGSCPIRNGVISACILIVNEKDEVVGEFIRDVRPPDFNKKLWSLDAQKVHGITFEQAAKFMPNDHFCFELLNFLKPFFSGSSLSFICHASPRGFRKGAFEMVNWFDHTFLEWCFRKAKFNNGSSMIWTMYKVIKHDNLISTIKMGRDAGYKGNRLDQWAERIGFNLKHHEATSDTYCCLEVYKYLKAKHEQENYIGN